ncbi:MAG: hypothetical protein JWM78_2379 [Verrucomicrobiaceae bacterium]|nr:hypothetical protein [Verrucomicrobiaceae bacterium]
MPTQVEPKFAYEPLVAASLMLLFGALVCAPMLWYGASNGHSIIYNLVWLKSFAAQIGAGDWYPRWLMDMNHGAGSPAFYFYGPLPFYVASLPALLLGGSKLTVQLAFGEWLLIALSGMAFYRYARGRFDVFSSLFCAALYMVLPYHFEIDLWRRQDIGELANYIWMPLVLYYTDKIFEGREAIVGLAFSYCLLMMSHLPSAFLFSIALGCYVAVMLWHRHSWRYVARFAAAISIGIALAAVYWVPALFSEQYVRAEKLWTPYFDFHKWFFPINESPHHDGDSRVFADRLFTVIGVTTAMFALFWLVAFRWRKKFVTKRLWGILALMGVAWFLMSSWSTFFWEAVPELWKVQFPWRIAMVVDLATAIAALHAAHCLYVHRDRFSAFALVAAIVLLTGCLFSAHVKHKLDAFDNAWWVVGRDNAVRNGLDAPEYTTRWNPSQSPDTSIEIAGQPQIYFDTVAGDIDVTRWSPRKIELQVNLVEDSSVMVRQFYFPNWRARIIHGAAVEVAPSPTNGLVTLALPRGTYRLQLAMVPLQQELIGSAITAGAVALLLAWTGWRRRGRKRPA